MRPLPAALAIGLALAAAAPARADDDTPDAGTLVLNDPAGGAPHSYALSTFQMNVTRPAPARTDGDGRPDMTVVLADPRTLDAFILQWATSPGGLAGPAFAATITTDITTPSGPRTSFRYDLDGAQASGLGLSYQQGSGQAVLSLTAAHVKLNGTPLY